MPKRPLSMSKALECLQSNGFRVPAELINFNQTNDWIKKKVYQVWECKKCGTHIKSPIRIVNAECNKQHSMKLKWTNPTT